MASIQSKITRQTKKQENRIHDKEKKELIETNSKLIWTLELADKDIKQLL